MRVLSSPLNYQLAFAWLNATLEEYLIKFCSFDVQLSKARDKILGATTANGVPFIHRGVCIKLLCRKNENSLRDLALSKT